MPLNHKLFLSQDSQKLKNPNQVCRLNACSEFWGRFWRISKVLAGWIITLIRKLEGESVLWPDFSPIFSSRQFMHFQDGLFNLLVFRKSLSRQNSFSLVHFEFFGMFPKSVLWAKNECNQGNFAHEPTFSSLATFLLSGMLIIFSTPVCGDTRPWRSFLKLEETGIFVIFWGENLISVSFTWLTRKIYSLW